MKKTKKLIQTQMDFALSDLDSLEVACKESMDDLYSPAGLPQEPTEPIHMAFQRMRSSIKNYLQAPKPFEARPAYVFSLYLEPALVKCSGRISSTASPGFTQSLISLQKIVHGTLNG